MAKWYKKQLESIEAVQFSGLNFDEIEEFVGWDYGKNAKGEHVIATTAGPLRISINDWIIKIKGEFYTMKPVVFYATYEPE